MSKIRIPSEEMIAAFVHHVLARGESLYRDFAWRRTSDPYAVLVSEVMLQQTQVARVERYFEAWMERFPDLDALAAAPLEAVLRTWQGLGYNRRALALKRLAEKLVADAPAARAAKLPEDESGLRSLPGVGPATAAGVLAFAHDRHGRYLETNVRTVLLHELFADAHGVPDRQLLPVLDAAACEAARQGVGGRAWNCALLDYGSFLKRTLPNPSRRSAHHSRQSAFEGSRRQMRSRLLRLVMESPGFDAETYAGLLGELDIGVVCELLEELCAEGFLSCESGRFTIA